MDEVEIAEYAAMIRAAAAHEADERAELARVLEAADALAACIEATKADGWYISAGEEMALAAYRKARHERRLKK